ncbi:MULTISPECIES: oligosaccharide flippase family protein [unclassified Marinobacter]|uniref:oligosaccharide flippase family protein n=1 Tax=unclassified Marinobacter TaxID=83889 RepID=UPI00200E70D8|nr:MULTISPECIES: oligosaccharide flippase family protein [unclassified Marinobacter]UQG54166.1 oligosaccharide flippase family protein [Marinobacter sp. M4C]UQG62973.1 oligosaccharide flippase family protein [Marinobacter sp. M2C]UQG67251.1 oligosaccharide flippase family protein [Marinobacter sp. M1C]
MSKVRTAIIISSVSQYVVRLIGLATTIIVARLLTPDEIGTFSVASAIVMIIAEFKLLGAADYLIREENLSEEKIRRALGLTMLISWGLGIFIIGVGPWVASYYELAPLAVIFPILSTTFFLGPFISIPMALVARSFNFKILLLVNILSSASALVVTVTLINLGFSFYSLAWGHVATILVQFLVVTFTKGFPTYWRPIFSDVGAIAKFGVYNSLTNLFKKGVSVAPDLVLGKMGTTAQVGMFSRGQGFVTFIAGTLVSGAAPVVLPYLSEAKRSGANLINAYTKATLLMGALMWPVLAVASVASLPAIRIFFGDQWDAAAPVASILAIWLILRSTHHFANNLLIASGNEHTMLKKEAFLLLAIFALVIFAFPIGFQAVAYAFLILGVLEVVVVTWLLVRVLDLNIITFYRTLLPNLLISLVCAAATYAISIWIPFEAEPAWKPICVIALFLPPIWLLSLVALGHPLYKEIGFTARRKV